MYIVNVDEDNIEAYTDYFTPDIAENLWRTFYRGLIVDSENGPLAGMIWEIRNMMKKDDNESNICFLRIDDDAARGLLFDKYKSLVEEDEVKKSNFSLPAKSTEREIKALEDAGFTVKFMEGDLIKCRLSEILDLKIIQKVTPFENIHALKTMTRREFSFSVRSFMMNGLYGLCEDLSYLPRSYFENDISCYSEADGEVNGFLLFHKKPSGALMVSVLAAIGKDYGKILTQMIKYSVKCCSEYYPTDTEVWIDRHNYAALALSEKLFPRGFGIPVYIGSREES